MMKQIFVSIMTVMVLSGCGSSSSSGGGGSNPPPSSDIEMVISKPYTVYPGDAVVKTSDPTLIEVAHTDFHEESTVVLIEGSATIIRQ
jgi:hypothetical protein